MRLQLDTMISNNAAPNEFQYVHQFLDSTRATHSWNNNRWSYVKFMYWPMHYRDLSVYWTVIQQKWLWVYIALNWIPWFWIMQFPRDEFSYVHQFSDLTRATHSWNNENRWSHVKFIYWPVQYLNLNSLYWIQISILHSCYHYYIWVK